MDPVSDTFAKRKQSSLNVEKAVKAQKISDQITAEPSSSSNPRDNVAVEPDTLFWIIITNVDKKAAFKDIFLALFKKCTLVRSHAFQSDSASQFRGIVEVAFERKEDAEEAVNHFHKNVRLFQKTWSLCNRRQTYNRSFDAGSSSSAESVISYPRSPPESSDEGLAQTLQLTGFMHAVAIATADYTKITITFIDTRVPEEVIVPLMETAGRLRSHTIFRDSDGKFNGTAEVVYERSEEVVAAIMRFHDNITFFRKTWFLERD